MRIRKRNNVQIYGNGTTPIMFAHGFGCDQHVWEYVIPHFFETYQVILFDYVGSGDSSMESYTEERYDSLEGYAEDVIEILDELHIKDCIFVGHSISGMIGLEASLKRPELFRTLVMLGSSPRYLNDGAYQGVFKEEETARFFRMIERGDRTWAAYLAPLAMKNTDDPKRTEELEEMYAYQNTEVMRRFAEVTFCMDMREKVKKNTVPSLLLQPKEDAIVPGEAGRFLRTNLPLNHYIELEETGHYPHLSSPDLIADHIHRYLETELGKSG
ncbi:alpha/beta hydrolase [Salimicrobium sp. PL1-032A]|uniref:alpha/beta fold hydrolase n=1 Tax=Salimicrobium sp. PL1-032A TaxID=3095364 RepID=UPI0032614AC2